MAAFLVICLVAILGACRPRPAPQQPTPTPTATVAQPAETPTSTQTQRSATLTLAPSATLAPATPAPAPTGTATTAPTATRSATPIAPPATATPGSTPRPTLPASPTAVPPPAVTVSETTLQILTYPYAQFLTPVAPTESGIPFARLDWGAYEAASPQPAQRSYRAIVLENELLRVALLPELGGRIYQMTLKPSGHNVLYNNQVLKPTRWGPPEQGWWLAAGGIEFCLPVEEHGYESAVPWEAQIERRPDAASVRLSDSRQAGRLRAVVSVTLRAGEARLGLGVRLENGSGRDLSVKYWTNAMLAPGGQNRVSDGVQFVFPASQVTVHSTGDESLPAAGQALDWPLWAGRDLSLPVNWRGWLGFFERPRAAGAFAGVYDRQADEGIARAFPPDVAAGVKGFGFGPPPNGLPASLWTDDGSSYVELHGGLAPTFDDAYRLPAGAVVAWEESWFPVAGLGGLTLAGPSGAAYVRWDAAAGALDVRLLPTRRLRGRLELAVDGTPAGEVAIDAAAGRVSAWQFASRGEPIYNAPIAVTFRDDGGSTEVWRGPYR